MHVHHSGNDEHTGGSSHTSKGLKIAFLLNLGFLVVEIVGGVLTNSVAILSDAVHDLGDTVTIFVSWLLERFSTKKRTVNHTYGFRRLSVLGALISAVVLILGSAFILYEAIPRLLAPEEVSPRGMLVLALVGTIVNGIAVLRLRGGRKISERVVFLHLLEDVMGWMAVLVVSVVLLFVDLPILDPILSLGITIFVLSKIIPNLKAALHIFLQYAPKEVAVEEVKSRLESIDSITDVHDIHVWSLDGEYTVLSAHVVIDKDLSLSGLAGVRAQVRDHLKNIGIDHQTIEFEATAEICADCDL